MTTATIRVVGRNLPGDRVDDRDHVHVAVQHGKVAEQFVPGSAVRAEFEVAVRVVNTNPDGVDLRGPFVQGGPGARFLYLCWGELAGDGEFARFGRIKVPLTPLPAEVAAALREGGTVWAELSLTNPDGRPRYASIPASAITWR